MVSSINRVTVLPNCLTYFITLFLSSLTSDMFLNKLSLIETMSLIGQSGPNM